MLYVIAIGTNIGDREENLKLTVKQLNHIPSTKVISSSAVYETAPIGYDDQQDFYNAVLLVESKFNPNEMLGICMGMEAATGRIREIKNGPRVLDMDIIFAENKTIDTPNLVVPHPRFFERRFVLQPLMDIFVDGNAFGIEFKNYLKEVENQEIRKTNIRLM